MTVCQCFVCAHFVSFSISVDHYLIERSFGNELPSLIH